MPTLADIRQANQIGAQVRDQNDATARSAIEQLSPYVDFLDIENPDYMNMDEEKFNQLYTGDKAKLIDLLNSSPTATSYKDITTQEVKKGKILDIIDDNGKISFTIQGEQGVVPKTLGFSNDPQDMVMFTDREGLRTMANTILQGQSNRLTSARKGYGSRALGVANLQGIKLNDRLEQAETVPEATGIIEQAVESGELDPAAGFEMMIEMGSDYNDGLDAMRLKLQEDLKENKQERTRLEKIGEPGKKTVFGTGVSGSMGDGSAGFTPPVKDMTTGRNEEEQKQYKEAQAEAERLRGRIGDTQNLIFPIFSSPEAQLKFIKDNEQFMIEAGSDQNVLDKARAAFNKYKVTTPEDLQRIPDYDDSIDISKAEIAAALAVAAGGDFNSEFQDSYRLLSTGDASTSPMDEQTFNRTSQDMNMRLDQYFRESEARIANLSNKKGQDIATRIQTDLKEFVTNMTDSETGEFRPENFRGKASVNFRNGANAYLEANQLGLLSGPDGLEIDGYFRNFIGTTMFNILLAEGKDRTKLFGFIGGTPDANMPLGDVTSSLRAKYQETTDGKQVLKEIIMVDSQGRQIGKSITGKDYSDIFNDVATAQMISRYIEQVPGN